MSAPGMIAAPSHSEAAELWNSLLRPEIELAAPHCAALTQQMHTARLTFGDRIHCPFLRPFFLSDSEERRIRAVAESLAAMGERVVSAALRYRDLLEQLALTAEEERLVRIEPGYPTASTASRLDSFLLPESLYFAEYNAESPAGPGYAETLGEIFSTLPLMTRFQERFRIRLYPSMAMLLHALLASFHEWGGAAHQPLIAIVDWREVPTWNEFEIIQARFEKLGVPAIVCDPRDLEFDGRKLTAQGRRIDLVYRRVLINDIIARRAECEALVRAYASRAVCVANTFRCKVPHKKAFFAVLTDPRNAGLFSPPERDLIRRHIPWTRLLAEGKTSDKNGNAVDLLPYARQNRASLVLKPNDEYGGAGVILGWEVAEGRWDSVLQSALEQAQRAWVVQERIPVRREIFPYFQPGSGASMKNMLVDLAPYLFRGRLAGFLTRLSSTGLANVTAGGGQVPAFVVSPRTEKQALARM